MIACVSADVTVLGLVAGAPDLTEIASVCKDTSKPCSSRGDTAHYNAQEVASLQPEPAGTSRCLICNSNTKLSARACAHFAALHTAALKHN